MIKIPKENVNTNPTNTDLYAAVQNLQKAETLLLVETAGSSKWLEIVLFILKILRFILSRLPSVSAHEKLELEGNGDQVAKLQKIVEEMAKLKESLNIPNKKDPCGEA